jgi:hypothetical protein
MDISAPAFSLLCGHRARTVSMRASRGDDLAVHFHCCRIPFGLVAELACLLDRAALPIKESSLAESRKHAYIRCA